MQYLHINQLSFNDIYISVITSRKRVNIILCCEFFILFQGRINTKFDHKTNNLIETLLKSSFDSGVFGT